MPRATIGYNMTIISDADALDLADDTFEQDCRRAEQNHNHPHRDYTGLPLWTDATMLSDDEFAELQELRKQYPPVEECDVLIDFWTGEEIP